MRALATFMSWLLVISDLPTLQAQSARGPSQLMEASTLASYSEDLFEQCQYKEAQQWLEKAIERAQGFRSKSVEEQEQAGVLVAKLRIRAHQMKEQLKTFEREQKAIGKLIDSGWLDLADRRLFRLGLPSCGERFLSLQARLSARRQKATALITQADDRAKWGDYKGALKLYLEAQKYDRQREDLQRRIEETKSSIPQGRSVAAKILISIGYTAFFAAVGYGMYLGYKEYKKGNLN